MNAPGQDLVEVVWLDLDLPAEDVAELSRVLSPGERARVAAMRSSTLARRATVRLARRRQVLAQRYDVEARDLVIESGSAGRPVVVAPVAGDLEWSTSHCGGLGVMALAERRRVGVDVEALSELPSTGDLTGWVASPPEAGRITAMAPSSRPAAYLRLWTRKEAYLKATGQGIGAGLTQVTVPFEPDPWGLPFRPADGAGCWLLYRLACPDPPAGTARGTGSGDPPGGLEASLVVAARLGPHGGLSKPEVRRAPAGRPGPAAPD